MIGWTLARLAVLVSLTFAVCAAQSVAADWRTTAALPPLPVQYDQTPCGRLRLVDAIDCARPTAEEEHPYAESQCKHKAYGRIRATADVKVHEILGKPCREALWNSWYAYRLGRGEVKPHGTYLVRIEYPEDKRRYASVEISTGSNYMDIGWKNGVSPDDPYDNYPISRAYRWYDIVVVNGEWTPSGRPSHNGDERYAAKSGAIPNTPSGNGFWVFLLSKGNTTYPQYEGGAAASQIRLYELDAAAHAPTIRFPEGQKRRTLTVDWERAPRIQAEDMVRYCKLMGYNAVSPVILKWTSAVYWEGGGAWPDKGDRIDGTAARSWHENFLASTRRWDIQYIPRLEFGGSNALPDEAKAIGPDGKMSRCGRYTSWGTNLLHPLALEDMKSNLIGEVVGKHVADNPQLTGILWRVRCGRMNISHGRHDVELFCKETGREVPERSDRDLARWAAKEVVDEYHTWWHAKRASFHEAVLEALRAHRPDMKLYIHLWDTDKFSLGVYDWFSSANWGRIKSGVAKARQVYGMNVDTLRTTEPGAFAEMIRSGDIGFGRFKPHETARPSLYRDTRGVYLFGPANYRFLTDNAPYLNYFRTGAGLALTNMVTYDEHARRCLNSRYETNMVTPGGPEYAMANEVLMVFSADPDTISYTVYTYGRGFAASHRRFAQAFLALPAAKGEEVADALAEADPDVKVRRYDTGNGVYVAVVNRAFEEKRLEVSIAARGVRASHAIDLVTGARVPLSVRGGRARFTVAADPMQLHSFLLASRDNVFGSTATPARDGADTDEFGIERALRQALIDGVKRGRNEIVNVSGGGLCAHGRIVAADDNGIEIGRGGRRVTLPWSAISARDFYRIVRAYTDDHEALAFYCRSNGLDAEAQAEEEPRRRR